MYCFQMNRRKKVFSWAVKIKNAELMCNFILQETQISSVDFSADGELICVASTAGQ